MFVTIVGQLRGRATLYGFIAAAMRESALLMKAKSVALTKAKGVALTRAKLLAEATALFQFL